MLRRACGDFEDAPAGWQSPSCVPWPVAHGATPSPYNVTINEFVVEVAVARAVASHMFNEAECPFEVGAASSVARQWVDAARYRTSRINTNVIV